MHPRYFTPSALSDATTRIPFRFAATLLAANVSLLMLACAPDTATAPSPRQLPLTVTTSLIPGTSTALTASISPALSFAYVRLPLDRATELNDRELVVGDIGGNNIAAYWTATGGLTVLGQVVTGSTSCCSSLVDVNAAGVAAGHSTLGGGISLTSWSQGTNSYIDLPTGFGRNFAQGINDNGDITFSHDGAGGRPFVRTAGGVVHTLSMAPAYFSGFSTDINNSGVVTGFLFVVGVGYHAVAWPNSSADPVDLGTLGGNQSQALSINNPGDIVGWSETTPGSTVRTAVLWPASGGIVNLRTWANPCAGSSEASDVSDVGVIIGQCDGRPVLWTAVEGMRYLPLPAGVFSGEAHGINNNHVIVGMAPGNFRGALWRPLNSPPRADAGGPYTGTEGSALVFSGAGSSDPDADPLSYDWDFGDGTVGSGVAPSHTYADNGSYSVTLTVTDTKGARSSASTVATIQNAPPSLGAVTGPNDPQPLVNGSAIVNIAATFNDPGTADTHTGTLSCDGGSGGSVLVSESGGGGTATATCTFAAAGVYNVSLTITDDDGDSDTESASQFVVVFDANGGFVTGGGWIHSPAGAYSADPTASGKATFGFVSKYHNGATAPSGNTEFQFHAGNLHFSSTSYQWLVVAGARAQFKGDGTVGGQGGYKFLLTATDGQVSGGGGVDRFRIKIWDGTTGLIVYDNVSGASDDLGGANPQALGAGSIAIKK